MAHVSQQHIIQFNVTVAVLPTPINQLRYLSKYYLVTRVLRVISIRSATVVIIVCPSVSG